MSFLFLILASFADDAPNSLAYKERILKTIESHHKDFATCFKKRKTPEDSQYDSLTFTIKPMGEVHSVLLKDGSMGIGIGNEGASNCLFDTLKKIKFDPTPQKKMVEMTYTFKAADY